MLKSLKGLIFEEEPVESPKPVPPPQSVSLVSPGTFTGFAEDPKYVELLLGLLKKSAVADYDYFKFLEGAKSLQTTILDETTRLKSTWLVVKSQGATKAKILDSAKFYQTVLTNERTRFFKVMDDQQKEQVAGASDRVNKAQADLASLDADIQRLQAEIQKVQAKQAGIKTAMEKDLAEKASWEAEIANSHSKFDAVYNRMVGEIEANAAKFNTILD